LLLLVQRVGVQLTVRVLLFHLDDVITELRQDWIADLADFQGEGCILKFLDQALTLRVPAQLPTFCLASRIIRVDHGQTCEVFTGSQLLLDLLSQLQGLGVRARSRCRCRCWRGRRIGCNRWRGCCIRTRCCSWLWRRLRCADRDQDVPDAYLFARGRNILGDVLV